MKFNRLLLSTIASVSILTLAACGSDDDDDSGNGVADNAPVDALLFDEAADGDIVNDPNNPQPLQLVIGENRVNGTVVSPDLDYLTINVPAGSELSALELTEYVSEDDVSFIAIQAGSVFTELPEGAEAANLLGFVLFGAELAGTDILDDMGTGEDAQGFTPPLEAGDYTFWIQETADSTVDYSFSFVVEESN